MKIYNLDITFTFGKYNGKTLEEIVSIQPSYIKWCILNVDGFVLPNYTLELLLVNFPKFRLSSIEENKRNEQELKWEKNHSHEVENEVHFAQQENSNEDLKSGDWDYDPMNPAHSRSENPWIDVFGPGDEAETAYWNTD